MPDETAAAMETPEPVVFETAIGEAPADMTLAQAMAAKKADAESLVSKLESDLSVAKAELASLVARIESIPAAFHGMSVKEIWAHIEGWFK